MVQQNEQPRRITEEELRKWTLRRAEELKREEQLKKGALKPVGKLIDITNKETKA